MTETTTGLYAAMDTDEVTVWTAHHLGDLPRTRPLTAFDLLDRAPGLPYSTARRALDNLAEAGVLHRVGHSDRYATRPDLPTHGGEGRVAYRTTNLAGAPVEVIELDAKQHVWDCAGCPDGDDFRDGFYATQRRALTHAEGCRGQALAAH